MKWIGKTIAKILEILLCSLLALLGLYFANEIFHFLPVLITEVEACDKFEIFRDLLFIFLATIGIIGYFVYKLIRDKLEDDLKKSSEENQTYFTSRIHELLSYIHYLRYRIIESGDKRTKIEYQESLDAAIAEAESAVSVIEKLKDKKYKGKASIYRLSLAYHLATRGNQDDKNKALKFVKENWKAAIKEKPSEEYNVRDTQAWVILKCSEDESEKEKAKKDISDLLKWKNIPNNEKEEMKIKYSQFGISINNQTRNSS